MIFKILISKLIIFLFTTVLYAKEINISSKNLLIDRENNISTFSGSVYVNEKDIEIWAEELIIKLNHNDNEIEEIYVNDNVKIVRENIIATSAFGYYYPLKNEIMMLENVEVRENENIIKCDELVLDIKNSISIMKSKSQNRVEATIMNTN